MDVNLKLIKYWLIFLFFLLLLAGMLISCARDSNILKDGYYTAEEAEYNAYGWKEYLTICISGGQIILVEYNAINPSGFLKSWDMDYMRRMNALDGTYPNDYHRYYVRQFLERQGLEGVDVLSGATESYETFTLLAKAVLKNAHEGNNNTTLVKRGAPF